MEAAPVVFIQYLAALAVVRGIKTYDKGYENLPVKMKWPNDICKYRLSARLFKKRKIIETERSFPRSQTPLIHLSLVKNTLRFAAFL